MDFNKPLEIHGFCCNLACLLETFMKGAHLFKTFEKILVKLVKQSFTSALLSKVKKFKDLSNSTKKFSGTKCFQDLENLVSTLIFALAFSINANIGSFCSRKDDKKVRRVCDSCYKHVCPTHSKQQIICVECQQR